MKGAGAPRWRNRIADAWDQMETRRREGRNRNSDINEDGSDLLPFGDVYRKETTLSPEKERTIVEGLRGMRHAVALGVIAALGVGVFGLIHELQQNPVRETAKSPQKKANDGEWTVPSFRRDPHNPMPTDEEMQLLEGLQKARENAQPPRGAEAFFTNGR
jgi:hypothetical protein